MMLFSSGCCCLTEEDEVVIARGVDCNQEGLNPGVAPHIVEAQPGPWSASAGKQLVQDEPPECEPDVGCEGTSGSHIRQAAPRDFKAEPGPGVGRKPAETSVESLLPKESEAEPEGEPVGEGGRPFEIAVERDGSALGILLDVMAEGCPLYVKQILRGCLDVYNKGVPPEKRVLEGDFILAANGFTERARMLQEVQSATGYLKLKIIRPVPILVTVERGKAKLGASVSFQENSSSLIIWNVGVGALKQHNDRSLPEQQVRDHDCILGVNGIERSADLMLQELKSAQTLALRLIRPPREAVEPASRGSLVL